MSRRTQINDSISSEDALKELLQEARGMIKDLRAETRNSLQAIEDIRSALQQLDQHVIQKFDQRVTKMGREVLELRRNQLQELLNDLEDGFQEEVIKRIQGVQDIVEGRDEAVPGLHPAQRILGIYGYTGFMVVQEGIIMEILKESLGDYLEKQKLLTSNRVPDDIEEAIINVLEKIDKEIGREGRSSKTINRKKRR